jgi:ferredoxin
MRRRELKNDWTRKEIDDQLGEFKVVTVPVDIRFEGSQKVLSFSEAEKILRNAKLISLEACTCRQKMRNCDFPVDDICIGVDKGAEEAMGLRSGRKATLDEAMDVLRKTHEMGLVHLSFELEGHKMSAICSCCECCCHALAAMSRFGGYDGLVNPSDMVASHFESSCSDCGICVEKCQFDAWRMVGGKVRHYPGKCAGCGVCVSFCPEQAISLSPRRA